MAVKRGGLCDVFQDESGFSTVGMVFALLITLSLIFSAAQVYQVNSASADVQSVADAAALAAANEVAEFYIVVYLCDAIVLSLSLTGIIAVGLSAAALCVPPTAALAEPLFKAAQDAFKARDSFASKAAAALNRYQSLLPFLSAANAHVVIKANAGTQLPVECTGFAMLVPYEGERITVGALDEVGELIESFEERKEGLGYAAEQAEEAAKEARAEKEHAFMHDCGLAPDYCMYERASTLAHLDAKDNPLYRSVDAWSFSVALKRAQAYYPARLAQEAPEDGTVDSQARSALRRNFYRYAVAEIEKGYVIEGEETGFDAYFPILPKNTAEMKDTRLYTEDAYPVSVDGEGRQTMHAWNGCPAMAEQGAAGSGSLEYLNRNALPICPSCQFSSASLGKVAAASSSIGNGFEYHYREVAEAAARYQAARSKGAPHEKEAKAIVDDLLAQISDALSHAASHRIEAFPPGRIGVISFAASANGAQASEGFSNRFASQKATLGVSAAISGAALVSESPEEGKTVISSMLDGVREASGAGSFGALGVIVDLWSSLLSAYAEGGAALSEGVKDALSQIPLASESGLGTWAAEKLADAAEALGLQPAKLDAPKPALVNTAHIVLEDGSDVSKALREAKEGCLEAGPLLSGGGLSVVVSTIESAALDGFGDLGESITIAQVEPLGEGGPSLPITIALPPFVKAMAENAITGAFDYVRGIVAGVAVGRVWW